MLHALGAKDLAAAGQHLRIDAGPIKLTGEAAVLDLWAAIHHGLQPGIFRDLRRLVVAHAKLHPHDLGRDPDRLAADGKGGPRIAKDIDDVDLLLDVGERGIHFFAEDGMARLAWIDRDHTETLAHQIFHSKIART